jgi:hypothetical protein
MTMCVASSSSPSLSKIFTMTAFTLALAQTNPTVGDVRGNLAKIRAARAEAMRQGADLVLTTELVTSGYPPEDLVLETGLPERNSRGSDGAGNGWWAGSAAQHALGHRG